jgi:hypothetical protein
MNVSAIIVTRGNVDLKPILRALPRGWEVLVWNNGETGEPGLYRRVADSLLARRILGAPIPDLSVYGRYAAIEHAEHRVIYVQDDDAITPALEIASHYEPGRLVANMPRSRWEGYPDSSLLGWGAIFDRNLPGLAFERKPIFDVWDLDPAWFHLTCDVVFSSLTPRTVVDYPFEHLPWAEGPDRMFTSRPTHSDERERMLELCRSIRGEDDDRRDW